MADLQNFAIGLLIFSLAMTTFVYFATDSFRFYNTDLGDEYSTVYNSTEENIGREENRSDELRSNIEQTEINTGFFQQVSLITDVIVTAIKMPIKTMYSIIITFNEVSDKVGVPSFIRNGIYAIIILSLSFAILNWIFLRRVR
jgi:hypothetical protein